MNINDLSPNEYSVLKTAPSKPLNINDLSPDSYKEVSPGFYENYIDPVVQGGLGLMNKVSSYTDAPTRAAIYAAEKSPTWGEMIPNAYRAGMNQMGQPPETAPTPAEVYGKPLGLSDKWTVNFPMFQSGTPQAEIPTKGPISWEQMQKAYPNNNPTLATVGGEIINAVLNPLNLIPGGGEASQGAKAAEETPGILTSAKQAITEPVVNAASSAGEMTSGINKNIIKAYATDTDAVNNLISKYGNDPAEHSSQLREGWNKKIQEFKAKLNNDIYNGLKDEPTTRNIDITDVVDTLKAKQSRLNPVTQADDIAQINKHIDTVLRLSDVVTDDPNFKEVPWTKGELTSETPIYRGRSDLNGKGEWTLNPVEAVAHSGGKGEVQLSKLGAIPEKSLVGGYEGLFPGNLTTPVLPIKNIQSVKYPAENFPVTRWIPNTPELVPGQYSVKTNVQDLHAIKQYLQKMGLSSYNNGGQIFVNSPQASHAANNAATIARSIFVHEDHAPIQITEAEAKLWRLHYIEDNMNKNLLRPEGSDNALIQAAANPGGFQARTLKKLQDVIGYDFPRDARRYGATRAFSNTSLVPTDLTGKAVARQLVTKGIANTAGSMIGAPLGYMAGKAAGHELMGAVIGNQIGKKVIGAPLAAATSPAGIKTGINVINSAKAIPRGLLNTGAAIAPKNVIGGLLGR